MAVLLIQLSTWAQGTILFNTHVPGVVDAPFSIVGDPPGLDYGALLMRIDVEHGGAVSLYPTTTFKTSSFEDSYYVEPLIVTVPDAPPGSAIDVVMGIFTLGVPSHLCIGASVVRVTLGGGELPPAYLAGLGGSIGMPGCVPEPSSAVLLAIASLIVAARLTGAAKFPSGVEHER